MALSFTLETLTPNPSPRGRGASDPICANVSTGPIRAGPKGYESIGIGMVWYPQQEFHIFLRIRRKATDAQISERICAG
jgi:hypothetical protein